MAAKAILTSKAEVRLEESLPLPIQKEELRKVSRLVWGVRTLVSGVFHLFLGSRLVRLQGPGLPPEEFNPRADIQVKIHGYGE